jgi:hypothetical protein
LPGKRKSRPEPEPGSPAGRTELVLKIRPLLSVAAPEIPPAADYSFPGRFRHREPLYLYQTAALRELLQSALVSALVSVLVSVWASVSASASAFSWVWASVSVSALVSASASVSA